MRFNKDGTFKQYRIEDKYIIYQGKWKAEHDVILIQLLYERQWYPIRIKKMHLAKAKYPVTSHFFFELDQVKFVTGGDYTRHSGIFFEGFLTLRF